MYVFMLYMCFVCTVPGSVVLNSTVYNAYESNGFVSICTRLEVDGLERDLTVLLTLQDVTAQGLHCKT